MNISDLLPAAKLHARVDDDGEDVALVAMLTAAAADVLSAAGLGDLASIADLPADLTYAVVDQAVLLYDRRGGDTDRPVGLSLAAARIVARYRGVRLCQPAADDDEAEA